MISIVSKIQCHNHTVICSGIGNKSPDLFTFSFTQKTNTALAMAIAMTRRLDVDMTAASFSDSPKNVVLMVKKSKLEK